MLFYDSLCVTLLVSICCPLILAYPKASTGDFDYPGSSDWLISMERSIVRMFDKDSEGYPVSSVRKRRSLFTLGKAAVSALLKKAIPVAKSGHTSFYVKYGGYQRAIDDFESVNPLISETIKTDKVLGGNLRTGRVGDRTINVLEAVDGYPPTLSIIRTDDIYTKPKADWKVDVILYPDRH